MRNQMEQVANMVGRAIHHRGRSEDSFCEVGIKFVALRDSEDIEAYLVMFERIMVARKIVRSLWPGWKGAAGVFSITDHGLGKL